MTAVLGALGEFLAWAAWVAWLLLGFARARPQAGDVVDDRGTCRWVMSVLLAAVAVRAVAPAAAIPGSRGVILIVGAAVALPGVALRQWSIVTLGRFFTERVTICRGRQPATAICSGTWPHGTGRSSISPGRGPGAHHPAPVQSRAFDLPGSAVPVMFTRPGAIPGNYRLFAGQSPN